MIELYIWPFPIQNTNSVINWKIKFIWIIKMMNVRIYLTDFFFQRLNQNDVKDVYVIEFAKK